MRVRERQGVEGRDGLGKVPVPELTDIAADPQFEPSAIGCDEFEVVWARQKAR
jgi:hypothetical protein